MKKENFIKLIQTAEKFDAEIERWYDFGIELQELPICELPWKMFDCYIDDHFTEDGIDWINWYLFERRSIFTGEVMACWDEEGNEFYVNTPEDLWELVEQHQLDYSVKSNIKSNIA